MIRHPPSAVDGDSNASEFQLAGKNTDNLMKPHIQDIVPGFEETGFRIPAGANITEASGSEWAAKAESLESAEIAFLKDVQECPDSGIAARYKRLELSVRQGEKIKVRLLEERMIEENQEIARAGRLIAIHLAEKGKLFLSKAGKAA